MRLKILLLVQKNQQKNQNLPNYLGETPNPKFFYKIYRTPGIRIISISNINLKLMEHSIFYALKLQNGTPNFIATFNNMYKH